MIKILPLFLLVSCIHLARNKDAWNALNFSPVPIEKFDFRESKKLEHKLSRALTTYRRGTQYLNQHIKKMNDLQRAKFHQKIILMKMEMNIIEAQIKNLGLAFPNDWLKLRSTIKESLNILKNSYKEAHQDILGNSQ